MIDGLLDGELPEITNTESGVAVVCSTGHTLSEDLKSVPGGDIIAVNQAGIWLDCKHWYTTHPERLNIWTQMKGIHQDIWQHQIPMTHSKRGQNGADILWPISGRYGRSSGLTATIVAILLGYDEIILAGMPADGGGYFFPEPTTQDYGDGNNLNIWRYLKDNLFNGKVRSISGNTKAILDE